MSQVKTILEFWFGHPDAPDYGKPKADWFTENAEFDQEIRNQFLSDYQKVAGGYLEGWIDAPESCLALILLLDQFPRNMFRGQPEAFATDWEAVSAAEHAVVKGYDSQLLPVQRWFIYLPFEHSENLSHQRQCVQLFQQLSHDPNSAKAIENSLSHQAIIQRFGRFPHRNSILGRNSTKSEKEFLQKPSSWF
ncbi:DUF924 family protein [Nodularia harveyana UHCC-0300]|uniref:DUF924 family protein n=1 Tax=Nodularia harveyana UHCC-0300 TaxID=2974287 RepID=A0ABU5U9S1_9CYAN|nr:DUF924 family protein [Nodularia harveyana]MEA5580257.1 DUF924 family protein [Nodularia harveyana UHCC-0300]